MNRRLLVLAALLAFAPVARADFAPTSDFWDGGRRFHAIAREESSEVVAATRIDLDRLEPSDAVVLLAPDGDLPINDLVRFARAGGRLVVADDFGSGRQVLARFGISLADTEARGAPRLRGDDALVVAERALAHPLSEGVPAIVANRPAGVTHAGLRPVFSVGDAGFVLTGIVGDGRVVAVADPSVFLNEMLALAPNRRFARNLVRFVAREGGKVYVLRGAVEARGSFNAAGPVAPLARLENALADFADTRFPDAALRLLAACLGLVTAMLLVNFRSQRREPRLPWLEPNDAAERPSDAARAALRAAALQSAARRLGAPSERRALELLAARLPADARPALRRGFSTRAGPDEFARAIELVDRALRAVQDASPSP